MNIYDMYVGSIRVYILCANNIIYAFILFTYVTESSRNGTIPENRT